MAYTEYFQFTTGSTIYGKARPYNVTWATGIVALSENGTTVNGTAPTLNNADNAMNIIPLFYDGSTWFHV